MKSTRGSIILFFVAAAIEVEKDSDAAYKYGPEHCVQLSRSKAGTCVIETNCPTDSIGNFTFDFLCTDGGGGQVIHSFGTGGFLDQETFDTGVSCHTCAPAEGGVLLKADSEEASTTAAPAVAEEAVPPKSASFYGPGSCVSSYRSPTGTCIVETRCSGKEEQLKDYNVGLTCVEAEGSTTRHLFGVNSFDPEETFDTLIPCKLCLGLDGEAIVAQNLTALAKSVSSLADGIEEVKKEVAEIKEQLAKKKNTTKASETSESTETDVQSAPTGEDGGDADGGDADSGDEEQTFLSRKSRGRRTRKTHARARHARKPQYLAEDRVDDDVMDDSGDSIDDVDPDVDPDLELDSDAQF